MNRDIAITHHAYQRGKERLGLNKKALDRMVKIVLEKGTLHDDIEGRVRKYLDQKAFIFGDTIQYIYGEHIYCFIGNALMTILRVPNKLDDRSQANQFYTQCLDI